MNTARPILPSKAIFSSRRIGFVLAGATALLIPVHFFVSCEESSVLGLSSLVLFAITLLLCLATPPRTIGRFDPAAFAFGACLLNLLSAH